MTVQKSWKQHLESQLFELEQAQLLRQRGLRQIDDTKHEIRLDFGSNDYLGLRKNPAILRAIEAAIQPAIDSALPSSEFIGWGSGASPVLNGHTSPHRILESKLASMNHTNDAMVFSSGYACNVGVLSCLADIDCIVFSDQLNHASLIDGLRLSRSERVVYQHVCMKDLSDKLERLRCSKSRGLIVTESIFSMDGDEAPLREIAELAERFDCGLIVDEAHATGVFGTQGGGLVDELKLTDRVLLKLGTLSKALGGIGGYAAGDRETIQYLVNRCRSFLFSTAPPPLAMLAASAAIEHCLEMHEARKHLHTIAAALREQLRDAGWNVTSGRSPIVPVIIGEAKKTLRLSAKLLELGIYVPAIRPPTVPQGSCRLRISLSANHTSADIATLIEAIGSP